MTRPITCLEQLRSYEPHLIYSAQGDSLLEPEEYEKLMEVKIQHEKQAEKYGGHLSNFDLDRVNISEEVNKTAIWLQVIKDGENPTINPENTR